MTLQILDLECLNLLKDKACIETCLNKYQNYPKNDWIYEICDKNPFIDTKYTDLPDIEFDMSADKSKAIETDFENVKRVYSALRFLSDSNASEERLWVALCLSTGYSYVQYRWPSKTVENVHQHYFFAFNNRRSYTRNAIARLWWIGRLTYDSGRKDPYELTEYVCRKADHIFHLIERNTSNNLHVIRPVIEAILEAEEKGYDINTDDVGNIAKYLNLLGGMYILDYMPEEWIKEKISKKIDSIVVVDEAGIKSQETKKKVDSNSTVLLQSDKNEVKIVISMKKKKYRTSPKSLIGLKIGASVKVGTAMYHIIDIK